MPETKASFSGSMFFEFSFSDEPLSPEKYQSQIRAGFSTNWFKTEKPMEKYSEQNIKDVHKKGFSNLRIRCRADQI